MTRPTTNIQPAQNIRIWTYWNEGIVRLTIPTNGDTVTLHRGGQTDEGWYSHAQQYRYEDGFIICNIDDAAADCDGRHGDHREFAWHVEHDETQPMREVDGRGNVIELDEIGPVWRRGLHSMRDDYAEAAGY